MTSLCIKFQPSSTPLSDRFWWGVLVVLVLVLVLVLLVTGVKQSQLLFLRLSLEFDNKSLIMTIYLRKILTRTCCPSSHHIKNSLGVLDLLLEIPPPPPHDGPSPGEPLEVGQGVCSRKVDFSKAHGVTGFECQLQPDLWG